ncbi:MAG: hypothetical protein EOO27_42140 [Comamonadaceae bacterium]|nr:MAG: hypothetical protein EOO27_42140 [Comamonadaceae bacterium]
MVFSKTIQPKEGEGPAVESGHLVHDNWHHIGCGYPANRRGNRHALAPQPQTDNRYKQTVSIVQKQTILI